MRHIRLYIDDIRRHPAEWYGIKTVDAAIRFIEKYQDEIEIISLDHDAGDYYDQGGDYIQILNWLEEQYCAYHKKFPAEIKYIIHSGNPVGVQNMERIIRQHKWQLIDEGDLEEGYP